MGLFSNDCNMFSGGMFGNAILSSISPETYFNLLAGDAFSIDTGIYINAGDAISIDKQKINGVTAND